VHRKYDSGHVNEYELNHGTKRHVKRDTLLSNQEIGRREDLLSEFGSDNGLGEGRRDRKTKKSRRGPEYSESQLRVHQAEYELYHNGKGVPNCKVQNADYFLEEGRPTSNRSGCQNSFSSSKQVGSIRTKKSPQPHQLQSNTASPLSMEYRR
jgi:hypothetical protein